MLLCIGAFVGVYELEQESALTSSLFASASSSWAVVDSQSIIHQEDLTPVAYHPRQAPLLTPGQIDDRTLWLARCIYSETKRPVEQELVAWVVRNRVETGYRGIDSYYEAVLDPYQFSAFNRGNRKRSYYLSLGRKTQAPGWQRALAIAHMVLQSDVSRRPFPATTRHFFSEVSMPGGHHPYWSFGERSVVPERDYTIDRDRFRFYAGVQ